MCVQYQLLGYPLEAHLGCFCILYRYDLTIGAMKIVAHSFPGAKGLKKTFFIMFIFDFLKG